MSVGTKGFVKREFVLTVSEGKYPQDIQFELGKERCDIMDKFSVGDSIKVHFDVRGREYNGKHYVNLQAWKVEGEGSAPAKTPAPMSKAGLAQTSLNPDDSQDVPF